MQSEEVLKLIGSAPKRYESVRAALRYRGDGTVALRAGGIPFREPRVRGQARPTISLTVMLRVAASPARGY